jgi:hypothetical protein
LNALIPKDVKVLEGSGGSRSGRPDRVVEVQRAPGSEAVATGATGMAAVEPKGGPGAETIWKGREVAGQEL